MSNPRNTKRKRTTGPMIVGEVDSAQVVTPKTIYKTKKDGTVMSTQIWESLDPLPSSSHVTPAIEERGTLNHEPAEFPSPPPEGSHTFPVSIQSLNPFSFPNIRRRHNVVTCSSTSTAWTNFSRLYCRARLCRRMPEHATSVTNQLRFGDAENAFHPPRYAGRVCAPAIERIHFIA